jgi:hypothetical protein
LVLQTFGPEKFERGSFCGGLQEILAGSPSSVGVCAQAMDGEKVRKPIRTAVEDLKYVALPRCVFPQGEA